ncbi:hypothetical protein UFOVP352_47 [uncultured Caudovirales phage]|uniref:Uncharacterized protein n=1 Tax=uncultured Caudovirales phage TaxID=2100421 RepID=A0A6J5SSR9_9CAUD|nr:hypothetical protein UFOVP352_47 [uncultured Caudovirales phage]CAB4218349.1 hypothetical protein UFOVP1607_15 [uncultured Caudovirales phage]
MTNLNTTCFTIENLEIVEATLENFTRYIQSAPLPWGNGYVYYPTKITREVEEGTGEFDEDGYELTTTAKEDVWVLAHYHGKERIVREFESEEEANAAAEESYVHDILNNSEQLICLDREEAESVLADMLAEQDE